MMIETCAYCGREADVDDENAALTLWPCEVCNETFCHECFERVHGKALYREMVEHGNYVCCPECFPMYRQEIFNKHLFDNLKSE